MGKDLKRKSFDLMQSTLNADKEQRKSRENLIKKVNKKIKRKKVNKQVKSVNNVFWKRNERELN